MWTLVNQTPYTAERAFVRDQDGAEVWLVLIKATFDILPDGTLRRARIQPPVDLVPVYWESVAGPYLRRDSDLVATKAGTEVLVEGCACAPRGHPVTAMEVALQVGSMTKRLRVVGDRQWRSGVFGPALSEPQPFERMPIVYARALGGVAPASPGEAPPPNPHNPVGTGHARTQGHLHGIAAPNIEAPGASAQDWQHHGVPAGFGPLARHWSPRRELAGTFDANWARTRQPLLPADFDERFNFSAPADQCFRGFLTGGEAIALHGLSPAGVIRFALPRVHIACKTLLDGRAQPHGAVLHTVHIAADKRQVSCVWHSRLRCHRKEHLIERSVVYMEHEA